jgi:hypothetical protein
LRIPSTAEDVFADIQRPARALLGDRRKRFDLESFMNEVYAECVVLATWAGRISNLMGSGSLYDNSGDEPICLEVGYWS